MELGCVVMAAGSSSRFGSNKLLQLFCGRPLYQWALDAVPGDVFAAVRIVTGYEPVAALARERGFCPVLNDRPEDGVSRTIRLGLEGLQHCRGVLFMTADQPLLTRQTVRQLAEAFLQMPDAVVAASAHGMRGNPCLFPRELFPELLALEGDTGGARVIKAHADRLRLIEVPEKELADCDTAQALWQLEHSPFSAKPRS